jgi:hypothetical protein
MKSPFLKRLFCEILSGYVFNFSRFVQILLLVFFGFLSGCCTHPCSQPNHVVIVNPDGKLCAPQNSKPFPSTNDYAKNLYFTNLWAGVTHSGKTNIVIFIQGGLNSINDGIDRANNLSQLILTNGQSCYPIFIAWNANLFSSYWDHLVKVHRGKTDYLTAGFLFPWTIIADTGRLIAESPISFYEQFWSGVRTYKTRNYKGAGATTVTNPCHIFPEKDVNNEFLYLSETERMNITLETNSPDAWFGGRGLVQAIKSIPLIPVEAVVDTDGKIAWDQMLRRTKTMFITANDYSPGGVEIFTRELCGFLANHANMHVILVGHSMGSIIANEMIREHGNDLHLSDIVYLAPACGTEDFDREVVPFLKGHTNVMFYDLCQHPGNESGEDYYHMHPWHIPVGLIAPQGSLLDWIDYYYSSTETDFGRTMGKWENTVIGMRGIDPKVYNQISIKTFGMGSLKDYGPQHHGDLSEIRFWDPKVWNPTNQWDNSMWICPK